MLLNQICDVTIFVVRLSFCKAVCNLGFERFYINKMFRIVSSMFMGGSSSGGIRAVVWQQEGCWFDPRAPPPPS